jgi:hypothetical protein
MVARFCILLIAQVALAQQSPFVSIPLAVSGSLHFGAQLSEFAAR